MGWVGCSNLWSSKRCVWSSKRCARHSRFGHEVVLGDEGTRTGLYDSELDTAHKSPVDARAYLGD